MWWFSLLSAAKEGRPWNMDWVRRGLPLCVCYPVQSLSHCIALFQAKSDVSPLAVDKLIRLNHRIDCPVSSLATLNSPILSLTPSHSLQPISQPVHVC